MNRFDIKHVARGPESIAPVLRRALCGSASALACTIALLGGVSSAHAGTNGLTVFVTPLAPNLGTQADPKYAVSYSGLKAALGQRLNSAFQVSIKNDTTSNVNNAWFKVQTAYSGAQTLTFLPDSIPSQCSPQTPSAALTCQFNATELVAGVNFTLVVENPDPPNSGADNTLQLISTIQAGQGNADSNPSNVVVLRTPVITVSVNAPAGLRSYVLGGKPFKVAAGSSETQVTPPVGVPVDLLEQIVSASCSPMYKKCLRSTLSIKDINGGIFQFGTTTVPGLLQLDLLRDKSTLKGTADINVAYLQLRYTPDGGTSADAYDIPVCVADSSLAFPWNIGALDSRCVVPPSGGISGGTFVDAAGNFHFRLLGKSNGQVDW